MSTKTDLFLVACFIVIVVAAGYSLVAKISTTNSVTPVDDSPTVGTYSTVCLDGVLYWNQFRKLAPYIDKETLTYKRCEVKTIKNDNK